MEYKIMFKLRIDEEEPSEIEDISRFLKGKLDGWGIIADEVEIIEINE